MVLGLARIYILISWSIVCKFGFRLVGRCLRCFFDYDGLGIFLAVLFFLSRYPSSASKKTFLETKFQIMTIAVATTFTNM